jgi:hypothetical protein
MNFNVFFVSVGGGAPVSPTAKDKRGENSIKSFYLHLGASSSGSFFCPVVRI